MSASISTAPANVALQLTGAPNIAVSAYHDLLIAWRNAHIAPTARSWGREPAPHYRLGVMRYLAVAFIATIGLGACTEPGRQVLAPTAATNCRDATLIAVDTIIDYSPRPGAFPALLTRSAPRLPKAAVPPNSARVITMSFVIDTSGYVIGPSVQIETAPWPEGDQVVCDWLRRAQFEPVRRGGRAAVDP